MNRFLGNNKNIFTKKEDIEDLRTAAKISTEILMQLRDAVQTGKNAKEIDNLAFSLTEKANVRPAFLGVPGPKHPFPGAVCISTNDETLHGIPYESRVFQSGDIVKVDFGIVYKNLYTDHCVTVALGEISEDEQKLINTAKLCIDTAVKKAIAGNRVGDISFILQTISDLAGFDFVTSYCGHGVGRSLHEDPQIPSYGRAGTGPDLKQGMVICIENQLSLGSAELVMDPDGWTLRTEDGSKTAMFEHMVLVQDGNAEVLTRM
jgi:methionyl aminopeptidase